MRSYTFYLLLTSSLLFFYPRVRDHECDLRKGDVATVSILISQESKPTSANVLVGGHVTASPEVPSTIINKKIVEYRDRILQTKEAQLQKWGRTFVEAKGEYQMIFSGKPMDNSGLAETEVSPVEGRTMTFDWDSESGSFKVSCSEGPEIAPSKLLQTIVKPSVSASFLCPDHSPADGGPWTVSVSELRDFILQPCGDLFAIPKSSDSNQRRFEIRQRLASWGSVGGDVEAKIAPSEKGDDSSVVRISLSGKLSFQFSVPFVEGKDAERHAETSLIINGAALWDKASGRLRSIVIDGSGKSELSDDIAVDRPSGKVSGKLETCMDEKWRWKMGCQYDAGK